MRLIPWLLIGAGGAVGAIGRYALSFWVQNKARGTFPWGTLTVNVLGCLLIGILTPLLFEKSILRPEFRMMILVGMLGAFTTWSTFGYETIRMISEGEFRYAASYVLCTNVACLTAVWLAYRITERSLSAS